MVLQPVYTSPSKAASKDCAGARGWLFPNALAIELKSKQTLA
jgi:hypothetical protein